MSLDGFSSTWLITFCCTDQIEKVVFFASWCSGCVDHIKEAPPRSVFVATFDEKQKASEALVFLLGNKDKRKCFWDNDGKMRDFFKVTSLPKSIALP